MIELDTNAAPLPLTGAFDKHDGPLVRAHPAHSKFLALAPGRRASLVFFLVLGAFVGALLAVGLQLGYLISSGNFYTILPGQAYRCAQLSGPQLERVMRKHGIRTVVNLRGWEDEPWYYTECQVIERLGADREDVNLVTGRLPWVYELQRLVDVLDRCEYPILVHCYSGADRSGLAAALLLLLKTDCSLDEARHQLGLRYGHFVFKAPAMDQFFDLYEGWLRSQHRQHSATALRWWIDHDYCPGRYRFVIEPLDVPQRLALGTPAAVRVRLHNTSIETWRLSQSTHNGVHLGYFVDGPDSFKMEGRAGLFDASVAPGDSVDVTVVLPAVKKAGSYHLTMDVVDDEAGNWFSWGGSSRLDTALEAR